MITELNGTAALITVIIVTLMQVLMKIRNELAYARLDLERAIKTNCRVRY